MTVILEIGFVLLLGVVAWLCWLLSRAHLTASAHCQCISDMLVAPDQERAHAIADRNRTDLIARGLWKS